LSNKISQKICNEIPKHHIGFRNEFNTNVTISMLWKEINRVYKTKRK